MASPMNHPFNVMRHHGFEAAPRDPVTIGAAILGSSVGTTAIFLGLTGQAIVGYIATTLVTSWVMSALTPKPDLGSLGSSGTLVNAREAAAAHQIVYGQMRKGGTITFIESTGNKNEYLHLIIALAGHAVDQIGDIYIDDEIVSWDPVTGNVTDAFLDGSGNPTMRIRKYDGTQIAPPTELLNESELTGADALNSNFVGRGIAYLYVRMKYDQNAYPNGIPLITAVVRGKKVYDPRSGQTVWSDNAALCVRDYITADYGLSDPSVDETAFAAAANICDELVGLSGSGTTKRYTINGVVQADSAHGAVLNQMVTACAGTLFWGTGKWKLTVADYVTPTKTLTMDDLRSGITVQTRNNLRDQFNVVQGTFINADGRWITQDYPPVKGAGFIVEDGNIEQALDLQLPFTTSAAIAQRLAKLTLYRGREQMVINADFGMNAFDVEVGEIIELTIERYGWTAKEFEVIGWQLRADQDAGDLRVALTLRETSEAAFDWNAEESQIISNNTNLPDAFGGLTISNLTASGGGRTQGDGTFISSAILNWDDVANAFFDHYEVEWKPVADSVYNATTSAQSSIELSPIIDGVQYIFRARAVTVGGVQGPWASVQFTGGGDVTAPSLPTSISATGGFQYVTIKWTNPADTDLNYVEVWEADTNNSASATRVGVSAGDTFQRTNLPIDVTKWYFLKAVDHSGNASGFTAGVSATTTGLDDADFTNGIYSLFRDQGLYAIRDVTSLPPSGAFVGEKVFNRTDGKLYQWTGSAWDLVIAEPDTFIASDKIIANTITGGLLATSGIITNSAQIENAVIQSANIGDLQVGRIKIARGAVTNSLLTFTSMSFSQNTSGTYGATSLPPTDLNAAGYFVIGSQSYTVPSDAPDQLWMRLRPTWTLFYALLVTPPAANHENGWWHHINVTNQSGSVVTANYYAVVQQFQSNGYVVFTPNHKTDGETLPVLKLGENYSAGDVLTFTHRFYRYRSSTAYGVGAAVSGVSLRVDEVYR